MPRMTIVPIDLRADRLGEIPTVKVSFKLLAIFMMFSVCVRKAEAGTIVFDSLLHALQETPGTKVAKAGFTRGILGTVAWASPVDGRLGGEPGAVALGASIHMPAKQGLTVDWKSIERSVLKANASSQVPVISGADDDAVSSVFSASPATRHFLSPAEIAKHDEDLDSIDLQLALVRDDEDTGLAEVDVRGTILTFLTIGVMAVITYSWRLRKPAKVMTTNRDLAAIIAQGFRPQKKQRRLDPKSW
jgi:hypothetical protein